MVEQDKREREEGDAEDDAKFFSFRFEKHKMSPVHELCKVFYVGGSTCFVSVPEAGLKLLDFESFSVTDITKPEFYGLAGVTNNGHLVFRQQKFATTQEKNSSTDKQGAFILEMDSDHPVIFDPKKSLEAIDIIRNDSKNTIAFENWSTAGRPAATPMRMRWN